MSQPTDNVPAPTPTSPAVPPTPAPTGGLKSGLKIAIPVVVLMAVIFGITFFAQYRPRGGENEDDVASGTEPPLRFFSSTRKWEPFGELQNRTFPGFYEVKANEIGTPNGAQFWFENRNKQSVLLQLKGVSCTSCSGGRVAPIPRDVARQILEMTAVSALPQGLVSGMPIGLAGVGGNLADDRLPWQSATFKDNPHAEYTVPGADGAGDWTPQWGILDLRFSVSNPGYKKLEAFFDLHVQGTKQVGAALFTIEFDGVDPFNLSQTEIEAGELQETSELQKFKILVYSSTRGPNGTGPGDLAPPSALVQMPTGIVGEPGPFVSVEPPVRVYDAELAALTEQSARSPKPVRLESAYWLTVVVSPKVGDKRADLGPLEREIYISSGLAQKTLRVKARVRGGVWLDDNRKDISLDYSFANGISDAPVTVITEKKDTPLALVPDPATPEFLQIKLEKYPADKVPPGTELGYHYLKLTVPPGKKAGAWGGAIVLEAKGPTPQRIRIPVRGSGR